MPVSIVSVTSAPAGVTSTTGSASCWPVWPCASENSQITTPIPQSKPSRLRNAASSRRWIAVPVGAAFTQVCSLDRLPISSGTANHEQRGFGIAHDPRPGPHRNVGQRPLEGSRDPAPPSPQGGILVSSYGPVATLSIFCADQALAPEFQPRRRGHSPLRTTPKTSSPALRAGLFLLRNSQSVILGSSDRAKDLLPIYVFPQLLPRPSLSGAFSFAKSHARPPLCCNP
jgi:hypothetical protein